MKCKHLITLNKRYFVSKTKTLYCSMFERVQPSDIDRGWWIIKKISTSDFCIKLYYFVIKDIFYLKTQVHMKLQTIFGGYFYYQNYYSKECGKNFANNKKVSISHIFFTVNFFSNKNAPQISFALFLIVCWMARPFNCVLGQIMQI